MLEYGYTDYTMYIGEHLGNPERERIRRMSLEEARKVMLINVLLKKSNQPYSLKLISPYQMMY